MSDWIPVPEGIAERPLAHSVRGVEINVFMSPYDVPQFVRGSMDEDLDRFIVEFRYLGEEPLRREEKDEHIALRVGKNSGRLYGIEVNVHALRVNQVQLNVLVPAVVKKAIDDVVRESRRHPKRPQLDRRENFEAAREAIDGARQEIFADLAAV